MLSKEGFCKALRMIRDQESVDEQFTRRYDLPSVRCIFIIFGK